MSQNEGREAHQAVQHLADQVCPFLGWYVDAETHHAYPSPANHCHTQEPPLSLDVAYQASTCLGHTWPSCPKYQVAQKQGVIHRPMRISWRGHSARRPRRAWLYSALAAGALCAIAALALLARPLIWPQASSTPAAATGHLQETAAAQGAIAANTAISPTTAPTMTPSPVPTLPRLPTVKAVSSEPTTANVVNTPAATAQVSPTLEPLPTWTSTSAPTATPLPPTATPTPRPGRSTPTPLPTPKSGASAIRFPAPRLVGPPDRQAFGANEEVVLVWEPIGQLAPNEYYVPTVAYLRGTETWYDETPWTKETRWRISDHRYLLDLADGGQFRWAVQVMQRTGVNSAGKPQGIPASPLSEVRALTWQRGGGGGGGGGGGVTPEPPPP